MDFYTAMGTLENKRMESWRQLKEIDNRRITEKTEDRIAMEDIQNRKSTVETQNEGSNGNTQNGRFEETRFSLVGDSGDYEINKEKNKGIILKMDYSFQIDMGIRDKKKNNYMMRNTNGHFRKTSNSYAEKFKRQKKKSSRVNTIKKIYGSEEDLVKTGSEDEDDLDLEKQLELARKARPKRAERRKQDLSNDLSNFKQRKDRSIHNQENFKPRTYTADNVLNVHKKSISPMSNKSFPLRRPLHSHAYPPSAKSGEIYFSPKFFNMYQVQENTKVPHEPSIETPNLEIDKERDDGDSRYEQMRSEARKHRLSILNRAEKLVENLSRSDRFSSDDELVKIHKVSKERRRKRSTKNKNRDLKYLQDRESSTSDDEKYVLVKTTVSPEPIDEGGVGLPRFIQPVPRNKSDNSLNSAEKTSDLTQYTTDSDLFLETEIPVESDDDESFTEQRPAAEVFMSQSNSLNDQKRFETVAEKQEEYKKGRLVTFFRNGDQAFKGYRMSITPKVRNFETLLVHLNDKIPTTSGVRYVFSLPDGKEIKSVTEFKPGRAYLVSSNKKVTTNLPYGHLKDGDWSTAKLPADKYRKDEKHLFQRRAGSPTQSPTRKARVITVENNNHRRLIKEKIIIDPQTKQNFEDILAIIGDLLHMNVHSLYTRRKPFKQVVSFSQLFREFQLHDMFIACQEGEVPIDRTNILSDRGSRDNNRSMEEINMTGSSPSESPPPMENGFMTSRSDDIEDDSVCVQINGKTRRYYPPSLSYQDEEGGKPDRKLKLEWIYGYHAKDSGNNLFVLNSGEVAYAVASVVVLFNYSRNKQDKQRDRDSRDSVREYEDTQRLYLGHTEEISSMALHPNNRYIASGQISGKENKAHIRIWDSKLLTTLNVIGVGFFDHGIISIDFSQQSAGSFLCVMDNADKHVLSIWDWQKERIVAKTTTTTLPVKNAVFYKYNDTILITYGQQHVYFWKLFWDPVREKEGRIMRDKRSGLFLGEIPNEICSLTFSAKGDVLTGDSTGSVVVWSPDIEYIFSVNLDLSETMKNAHKNPVTTLYMLVDNTLMTGGGLEIRAWDSLNGYRPANARVLPEATGHVKTIVPQNSNAADGRMYVATTKGHVLDGSLQDKFRFFLQGHSEDIWAVAPHPNEPSFFTTSFDRVVIKWSTNKHKIVWKTQMPKPGSCLTADLKGRQVAVGTQSGSVELLNAHNGMHASSVDISKYRVDCVAFSPDGTMIAAGSHDGLIHILDIQDGVQGYIPSRPLKGHPTFVTHIDWSSDSKYIQSTDGQYNMINWDIEKRLKINDPRVLRDADWHSYSCTTGFPVIGPWSCMEPGTHINAVHRSNYRDYMLTGDSRGRVRFYKYPCPVTKPEYRGVKLYSSDVTAACFMYDDMSVITAGGSSPVLAQWSVVDAIVSS